MVCMAAQRSPVSITAPALAPPPPTHPAHAQLPVGAELAGVQLAEQLATVGISADLAGQAELADSPCKCVPRAHALSAAAAGAPAGPLPFVP